MIGWHHNFSYFGGSDNIFADCRTYFTHQGHIKEGIHNQTVKQQIQRLNEVSKMVS